MAAKQQKTPEQRRYQQRVNDKMPRSKTLSQCVRAFISGGIICSIGQLVHDLGEDWLMLDEKGCGSLYRHSYGFSWGKPHRPWGV